ncbi:hypothetical protein Vadar_021746 [Vaccinium darrowii]|uniref:Uncharacterized protein n=1 Tax=Vaccinium darrowii TaxID=229202 RepID=A0ACB7X2M8_9ERIC|nr:hypothetical protein Vadar_021746 [Vaccinium darrowii]
MGELVPQKPEEAETEHSVPQETTDMASVSKAKHVTWRVFTPISLSRFWKHMEVLLLNNVYVVNVLGNIAYNFVLGAYSYWGPKAGYSIYQMKNADMVFGGVTMVCGILGTLAGGFVLDKMKNTITNAFLGKMVNAILGKRTNPITNAFKLLSIATFAGAALCFSSFCFKSVYAFVALFTVGEVLLFSTSTPVNVICLHCVQPSMRPIAMAMSAVVMDLFGDLPAPPLVGVLQVWIFLHKAEKPNGDCENQVTEVSKSNVAPLVDEMTVENGQNLLPNHES